MIVWLNGALVDETEARVSPFDHGLLVGDGVFETLAVFSGVPFAWTRHYLRLRRSAAGLGFEPPPGDTLRAATDAVIDANRLGDTEARLRITVTSGPGPLGSNRGDHGVTALVSASQPQPFDPTVRVVIVPWPRNERGAVTGLKTTSYAENVRALAYAHEQGAGEAIFLNTQGALCEGTGTNVYVVKDGRASTPPLESGCLDGVTRQLLLEVGREVDVDIAEITLSAADLVSADEAFISSSTRGAHPVTAVDGQALARAPGPITRSLMEAYAKLLERDLDP